MTVPNIQVKENNSTVALFWDVDPDVNVQSFNLYWSLSEDTSYVPNISDPTHLWFNNYALLKEFIPNFGTFGKKSTIVSFKRSDIGLDESQSFYVAISARRSDQIAETPLGTPKFLTYMSDQPAQAGALQSPITKSQRYQANVGVSPQRQKFSMDVMQLEVFNFSAVATVFLDVTGLDASTSESMPLMPRAYYVIGRQLSKDTGISMVADQDSADVRIMAHY